MTLLHSDQVKINTRTLSLSLTALPQTPQTCGTVAGDPERSAAHLVLGLGAGHAAPTLVQRVEPGVAADRGLAGGGPAGAGEALPQSQAGREGELERAS